MEFLLTLLGSLLNWLKERKVNGLTDLNEAIEILYEIKETNRNLMENKVLNINMDQDYVLIHEEKIKAENGLEKISTLIEKLKTPLELLNYNINFLTEYQGDIRNLKTHIGVVGNSNETMEMENYNQSIYHLEELLLKQLEQNKRSKKYKKKDTKFTESINTYWILMLKLKGKWVYKNFDNSETKISIKLNRKYESYYLERNRDKGYIEKVERIGEKSKEYNDLMEFYSNLTKNSEVIKADFKEIETIQYLFYRITIKSIIEFDENSTGEEMFYVLRPEFYALVKIKNKLYLHFNTQAYSDFFKKTK